MNNYDYTYKWNWMMDWCRKNGVSPAISFFWYKAEREFNEKHSTQYEHTPSN